MINEANSSDFVMILSKLDNVCRSIESLIGDCSLTGITYSKIDKTELNYEKYIKSISELSKNIGEFQSIVNDLIEFDFGLTHEDIDSSTMSAENQKNDFKNYPEILDCIFKKNPDMKDKIDTVQKWSDENPEPHEKTAR